MPLTMSVLQSLIRYRISHPRYENLVSKLLSGDRLPQEVGLLEPSFVNLSFDM